MSLPDINPTRGSAVRPPVDPETHFEELEQDRAYPVDQLQASAVAPLVSHLESREHRDAFTSLALNYVALQQQIAEMHQFKELVQHITRALEGIPSWDVGDHWSSARLLDTMLRTGLDTITETTGGLGFVLLYGEAFGLRIGKAERGMDYLFSATAQEHYSRMRELNYSEPRFGDEHTPLFKTVSNTGAAVVYSWRTLKNLTLQKRANLPSGHFPMKTCALLPFGSGQDGALVGLANGKYPAILIPEMVRIMQRFIDGVVVAHKRVHQRERAKEEAQTQAYVKDLHDGLQRVCAAVARSNGDFDSKIRDTLHRLSSFLTCSVGFCAIKDERADDLRDDEDAQVVSVSRLRVRDRGNGGAMSKAGPRSKASSGSGSRLGVRFEVLEIGDPIVSDFVEHIGDDDDEVTSKKPLEELLAMSSNTVDVLRRVVAEQRTQHFVGQEDIGVFVGAMVDPDRAMLLVPIWLDNAARGLFIFLGGTSILLPEIVDSVHRALEEHLSALLHSATSTVSQVNVLPPPLHSRFKTALRERRIKLRGQPADRVMAAMRQPVLSVTPAEGLPLYVIKVVFTIAPQVVAKTAAVESANLHIHLLTSLQRYVRNQADTSVWQLTADADVVTFGCGWTFTPPDLLFDLVIGIPSHLEEVTRAYIRDDTVLQPIETRVAIVGTTSPSRMAFISTQDSTGLANFFPVGPDVAFANALSRLRIAAPILADAATGRAMSGVRDATTRAAFNHPPESVVNEGIDPAHVVMITPASDA